MTATTPADRLTVLVLAGGAGRRLGGADKPLLEWQGLPMLDAVLARCPEGAPTLISANRNLDAYAKRGRVVTDNDVRALAPDLSASGPLIGVLGGLFTASTDWLLVSPGDTPNLPTKWASAMLDARTSDCEAVVAHDGERQQNLHLLLHRDTRNRLRDHLVAGRHEVYLWLEQLRLAHCHFSPDATGDFRNVNTEADLNARG